MNILLIGHTFPPETAALSNRLYDNARLWARAGHKVEVMTCVPNFPEGKLYEGYKNRFRHEVYNGIDVMRLPVFLAENKGTVRRTLSYISFFLMVILYSRKTKRKPDIVLASSPHIFSAISGYIVSRLKKVDYVLEIRDLWPESIIAVGAMGNNVVINFLRKIEYFLYRKASRIISVTNSYKHIMMQGGIDSGKIHVIKNGIDLTELDPSCHTQKVKDLRAQYGLNNKFVVSYIGNIGMAHRADIVFEAAQKCKDPDITFMVVGAGAERKALEKRQKRDNLENFLLVEKQSRENALSFLAISDLSVVHLRKSALFRTVIPSKIFESMAFKKPIIYGIEGETDELMREARAGIFFEPENVDDLLRAVYELRNNSTRYSEYAENGYLYVTQHHDRKLLAKYYLQVLEEVFKNTGVYES